MKLYYSDISNDITKKLTALALEESQRVQRVFYIAPNSLSFEKEKKVLSYLPRKASLSILVTRFAQMARYFIYHEENSKKALDDLGLSMMVYRVLTQFEDGDLQVYGRLKKDPAFIEQVVNLYKELQTSNMPLSALENLETSAKQADIIKILSALHDVLMDEDYENETKLAQFRRKVESGQLDDQLSQVVLIVDGFTRFSAEEEALIASLHGRVAEIHIASYASKKAYQETYLEGNVFQASVEFLRHLAFSYQTKPIFMDGVDQGKLTRGDGDVPRPSLTKLSKNIESQFDYSKPAYELTEEDLSAIEIWEATNQKEEVEAVARSIRKRLFEGTRYKDILVLLGDVDSYQLQIGKIFDKYEIPHYFGRAEEMSHHPLVHFVESLERLKRYNFRAEDLINLLTSGLYGQLEQGQLDRFHAYITFADLKGQAKFSRDFTVNSRANYDLEVLNQLRESIMAPLTQFFKARPQSGQSLLEKFMEFARCINLAENMAALSEGLSQLQIEKEEEVWKAFCHILEVFQHLFAKETLSVEDFLSLLKAGMQSSHYRTVPATVDVVSVKSYDLIEPHTAKYVYALGLSQSNFPKVAKNTGILTDEEKARMNERSDSLAQFHIPSRENGKKNHATFMSLLHSATEHLVLSAPQLYNEGQELVSPYLKLLTGLGVKSIEKGRRTTLLPTDVGHFNGLLSQVIQLNPEELATEEDTDIKNFWSAAVRYLDKKLKQKGITIPTISSQLHSQKLAKKTLATLYPVDQPLRLSVSSLTDFYKNEYLFFIKHVLRLQEQDSIRPDARSHGNFLHRIFERVTMDHSSAFFDEKLEQAIAATRQEKDFQALYGENADSRYSEQILLDVARASSLVLRGDNPVRVLANEAVFGQNEQAHLELEGGRKLQIIGKIDRLDQLLSDQALGVVDYKSSANSFKIDRFYNGLSPQLITYLSAVSQMKVAGQTDKVFGAMYLHLLDPIVKLADTKGQDQVLAEAYKSLVYKGLFIEEESNRLNQLYHKTKASLYSRKELGLLMAHNEKLYRQAASRILEGEFAINPYTEDGRSVAGDQLKAITGFEADRHLSQARVLVKGGRREDWLERMKGGSQS